MTTPSQGRNARRRGADAERRIVTWLRHHGWPDARRYLAGDGRQPGDIDWHPLIVLEIKDVASSSWPTWCRQAAAAAAPGQAPCVTRRTRGQPDPALWETRIRTTEWLQILGGDPDQPAKPVHTHNNTTWWTTTTLGDLAAHVTTLDTTP